MPVRRLLLAALAVALAVGCGTTAGGAGPPQPRDGQSGLRLSGTFEGRHVAVSDGLPRLVVGDCDPADGPDQDVCFISRTIDGRLLVLVFENPAVLRPGRTLAVADPDCDSAQECTAVDDVAVVDVQLDTGPRRRAVAGSVTLTEVVPFARYAGSVTLHLPDGRLSGSFDVVPRPD